MFTFYRSLSRRLVVLTCASLAAGVWGCSDATGPQMTATTISVTSVPSSVARNGRQQFVATGRDAQGNVVEITPTWSVVAGGGAINSLGMFTAGMVLGTFYNTIRATSDGISGFATVEVRFGPLGPLASESIAPITAIPAR